MEQTPLYAVRPLFPVYPEPKDQSHDRKRWIMVQGSSVLFLKDQVSGTVLMSDPLPAGMMCGTPVYIGTLGDLFYYATEVPVSVTPPFGWQPSPIRELSGKVPDSDMAIASYAVRILDYDRSTAFCGRCGAKTLPLTTERGRICTTCNHIIYPRISPAIIVLIKKGKEILLARSPRSPPGVFSVIAGFNEPGENLEQTVHREVGEEVGIAVRNLRYFGSEPWPFPDSLMIGFVADYAGGDIRVDNQEIEAAHWFTRDTLPPYLPPFPLKTSISRALIEAWIRWEV